MEWKTVHEIDGRNDVAVRVQRRGDINPMYSIVLGRRRKDEPERLMIFLPIMSDDDIPHYMDLLGQASAWLAEEKKRFAAQRAASSDGADFGREDRRSNGRPDGRKRDRRDDRY